MRPQFSARAQPKPRLIQCRPLTGVCNDRNAVFDHTFILELAINAYYPQISHFTVDV